MKRKLLVWLIIMMPVTAIAQKLPTVQKDGVRPPDHLKIDGKPLEWQNHFQAYNKATGIFYTMANDNENFYLVVQATDPDIINRIVGGGITFTIQKTAKRDDKGNISITYPAFTSKEILIFKLRGKKHQEIDTSARAADSTMRSNNARLEQACKWIRVTGIKDLDTLTSVYNDEGIKAAGLFNNKQVYTYEMAIRLKHLGFAANAAVKFNYHVRLNGAAAVGYGKMTYSANSTPEQIAFYQRMEAQMNAYDAQQSAATDFWGMYTLK